MLKFFDSVQYFSSPVKSDISPYKFAYLSVAKNIGPDSKNIECGDHIVVEKFWAQTFFFLN